VNAEKLETAIAAFMDYRDRAINRLGESSAGDAFRIRLRTLARERHPKPSPLKIVFALWRLVSGPRVRVPDPQAGLFPTRYTDQQGLRPQTFKDRAVCRNH